MLHLKIFFLFYNMTSTFFSLSESSFSHYNSKLGLTKQRSQEIVKGKNGKITYKKGKYASKTKNKVSGKKWGPNPNNKKSKWTNKKEIINFINQVLKQNQIKNKSKNTTNKNKSKNKSISKRSSK